VALPEGSEAAALVSQVFEPAARQGPLRPTPDWAQVHAERKRPGVTLQLFWLEYKQAHPDGYQYTQFCAHYHRWCAQLDPVLRHVHAAGEKVFVDYAGQTMWVVDPQTGAVREAQIFVGTLGASREGVLRFGDFDRISSYSRPPARGVSLRIPGSATRSPSAMRFA